MSKVLKNFTILIPCRKGSKGVPFKNRTLLNHTINSIPHQYRKNILVATDDEVIIERCRQQQINIYHRSEESATDTAPTKSIVQEIKSLIETDYILMLYLTYPERTWDKIVSAIKFYEDNDGKSLLCSKKLKTSPYLMMYKNGLHGRQIIKHDLYRRQDYPECFEISHYVFVANKKEINNLNNNLYNKETLFYPIDDVIDIDTLEDLETYNAKNKNNS